MGRFLIQPHVRLQEWVAEDEGYFREEGLEYEFDAGFAGASLTTSSVHAMDAAPAQVQRGAFEDMEKGRACDVSAACHWAVNAAASAAHGRMYGKAYSVCPSGIFVPPDSPVERPEDLAGVEIGVGYHSGSHYSAVQALEPFLGRDRMAFNFAGHPYDRVRLVLTGKVPAVNVFGAQYYLLEQRGCRKVLDTTFMMGFLIADDADQGDTEKYFRALRRAQRAIDLQPERYKHFWLREMPEDLRELADVRRFGPGERIVFEPYTREMYEITQHWMQTWDLFSPDSATRPRYEEAVLA